MNKRKAKPRERLNLVINDDTKARLERIKKECNADTVSEIMRKALTVFERLTKHTRDGGIIILRSKNKTECELLII